ncbi:unnamed protein product [Miscanthus lutarioriparius]|uniref:Aminotransferase-like plant mobile domain-containing protein n=1 Tax=Miscanthus lutarioriparius TaxID=422564 RepID=A0A811QFR8_9POAL|nr:unnamed protein product [Miscanthus lutarioriparius]
MDAGEHPLVEQSAIPVISNAADASKPYVLPALFLRPRAGDNAAPPTPPGNPSPVPALPHGIEAEFGRACPGGGWTHHLLVRRHRHLRLPLGQGHSHSRGHQCARRPAAPRVPVRKPMSDSLQKDVATTEAVWAAQNRSKKKPSYGMWVKRFVERVLEEEEEAPSAGGGGGDDCEAHELVKHGAFLSMWLSLFVLPGPPFDVVRREKYSPHRVARQLGLDQDIPGSVPHASSGWEKAWETYNIDQAESSAFIFPNHKPSVTVQYAKWWEPYSSACDSAIANAAEMKEGHDFVSPPKRKMEGVLAGNSGKKLRLPVATATRGRPPNIPEGTHLLFPVLRHPCRNKTSCGSTSACSRCVSTPPN